MRVVTEGIGFECHMRTDPMGIPPNGPNRGSFCRIEKTMCKLTMIQMENAQSELDLSTKRKSAPASFFGNAGKHLAVILFGWMYLSTVGCASLHFPLGAEKMEKASARNPVVQILCLWQPSEGRDPEGMPCRGFAGQILFLANRGSLPVQVNGDLRIYLFDDQGTSEEQAAPIRQYDFDSKSWAIHLTKGTLGPTYSVFVPYTRRGSFEAKCALRVRFSPAEGPAIFSDMAAISLDGRKKAVTEPTDRVSPVEDAKTRAESVSAAIRRTTTFTMDGQVVPSDSLDTGLNSSLPVAQISTEINRIPAVDQAGLQLSSSEAIRIEKLEQLVLQLLEKSEGTSRKPPTRLAQQNTIAENTIDDDSSKNIRLANKEYESCLSKIAHPPALLVSHSVDTEVNQDRSDRVISNFQEMFPHPLSDPGEEPYGGQSRSSVNRSREVFQLPVMPVASGISSPSQHAVPPNALVTP